MPCCCSCCAITCILQLFNIALAVAGGFLVFVGVVIQWNISEYGQFVPDNLSVPGYMLIVVGVGLVIVAILGFCFIAKMSRWIFITMMLILVGLEVTGGILAFSLQGQLETTLMSSMKKSMTLYNLPGPEGEVAKQTWNIIQSSFKCCGIENSTDWKTEVGLPNPPGSCYCTPTAEECSDEGVFKKGCLPEVRYWFALIESILGYLALSFAAIHLSLAAFTFCCGKACC